VFVIGKNKYSGVTVGQIKEAAIFSIGIHEDRPAM
jgi:hypothetical protein